MLGIALASPEEIIKFNIIQSIFEYFPNSNIISKDSRLLLLFVLLILCTAVLLKTILLSILTWKQSIFSQTASMMFGVRLYEGYMNTQYLWHTKQKTSHLITILGWRFIVGQFLFNSLQSISQLIVVFIVILCIFYISFKYSIFILSVIGFITYIVFKYSKKYIKKFSEKCIYAQKESSKIIHTGLNGIREIIIYQQQQKFIKFFSDTEKKYSQNQSKLQIFPPLPSWLLEFIGMITLFITTLLLYIQNTSVTYISAVLALLAAIAWRLLPIVNRIVQSMLNMQQQIPALENFFNMFHKLEHDLNIENDNNSVYYFNKNIYLNNIYFTYSSSLEKNNIILNNINITISRGSKVGIIGRSGAGKSTLINIIIGLYKPTHGKIFIDDVELNDINRASWMRSIGYVPQNPFLLNASLAENIAFSRTTDTIDRERVIECCNLASIDFVNNLEYGIDTIIGECGVRLSGGQLQRVAIARAIYSKKQILIFDEATSALDNKTEKLIQKTINQISDKITVLIIAHRLDSIRDCDLLD